MMPRYGRDDFHMPSGELLGGPPCAAGAEKNVETTARVGLIEISTRVEAAVMACQNEVANLAARLFHGNDAVREQVETEAMRTPLAETLMRLQQRVEMLHKQLYALREGM
jgi:hypothetical protein